MSHVDSRSFRENFPILKDTVYLSSCSLGARSRQLDQSITAMLNAMSDGAGAWHLFEEQVAAAREKFAPAVEESAYAGAMGAATGLVSVPVVSFLDCRRLDVRSIADAAHVKGALVFVDAYQTVGVEPLNVDELHCDYLVAGASKYMLGLPGVAFVYERTRREDDCDPQLTGWFGRENPFAFNPRRLDFAADARRLETGTPSVPALYAANAGLDLLLDLDMDRVREHVSGLVGRALDRLADAGMASHGPSDSTRLGAHVALHDPRAAALETRLAESGIRISPRGDLARLAFHYYNTTEDVDALCDCIAKDRKIQPPANICAHRKKTCAAPTGGASPDALAQAQLDRWREVPTPGTFPYPAVIAAYHERGKEFVSKTLLLQLDAIRTELQALDFECDEHGRLEQFLNVALDKFDGTYEYPSYCALPLWPLPTNAGARPDLENTDTLRDRQLLALTADCLRFELDARHGRTTLLPEMRPETATYEKRVRMGLNSARYAVERLGLPVECAAKEFETEAERLCTMVRKMLSPAELRALMLTMQPVYVVHDEYMFLRILQLFETNFAWMAVRLQSAIDAFKHCPDRVAPLIHQVNRMYREASKFFPVLATMQRDAFQAFRDYTEGASAIQSRNYKLVESLCRTPDRARRESIAYRSVPEIHVRVLRGQPNLDDALAEARAESRITPEVDAEICSAMAAFAHTLQQWRQIHFRLAVKMLGEATPGTGATEGTPYLSAVRSVPVFKTMASRERTC